MKFLTIGPNVRLVCVQFDNRRAFENGNKLVGINAVE